MGEGDLAALIQELARLNDRLDRILSFFERRPDDPRYTPQRTFPEAK